MNSLNLVSPITTHVLDTSRGKPAVGLEVQLEHLFNKKEWRVIGKAVTNEGGRVNDLVSPRHLGKSLELGLYRLTFDTQAYFENLEVPGFYPTVCVSFEIKSADEHYHLPLLLSPFGYSTYRGS